MLDPIAIVDLPDLTKCMLLAVEPQGANAITLSLDEIVKVSTF